MTLTILLIIVLLVLWFISVQRNIVKRDELCQNSMSQIGVQQASRWDALTALADLTKSYSEFEYKTLKDIIAQRAPISRGSSAAEANLQENKITEALTHILAVAEQYPALKSSETYTKTMDSVNTYENQVRMSRMVYNDTVTRYNKVIRQIPSNIVASILGYKTREYLVENTGKSEMPSMKL